MCVFQPGHGANQCILNVERQAGADAVRVILVCRQAFGLQKNLVAFFVGKTIDLVFHTRAITRPHPFDLAGEHGTSVKAAADDVVGALVGMGNPARHLRRVLLGAPHEAEHRHHRAHAASHAITGLLHAFAEVNRPAIQAWRCASFEAALRQFQLFEARTQGHGRRVTGAPGGVVVHADVDLAVQEGPRRQHHGAGTETNAHLCHGPDHTVTFHHQVVHRLLKQPQIRLVFQAVANRRLVQNAVGLGPRGAHRRSLA